MQEKKKRIDPAKEASWRDRIKQWEASGLSIREFCQKQELKETSFHYWRREIKRRDKKRPSPKKKAKEEKQISFASVQMTTPFLCSNERLYDNEIEISLSNGSRIRFRSGIASELLREVLRIVGTPTC
jgi:hypothetical protein